MKLPYKVSTTYITFIEHTYSNTLPKGLRQLRIKRRHIDKVSYQELNTNVYRHYVYKQNRLEIVTTKEQVSEIHH